MPSSENILIANAFDSETIVKLDEKYITHHLWEYAEKGKTELIQSLDGKCRAVATASWVCDERVYDLRSIKIIAAFGVGVEGINFLETKRKGIKVTNTPGVLNDAVADIAIALILTTMRNIINAEKFVRNSSWEKGPFPPSRSLAGKTLGIVGLGRIGDAIVHRALPFKMKIAYHNRSIKNLPYTYYPSVLELADNSDILLCVLPGGEGTRQIIDGQVLQALGPEGIFINVGRGTSVDEKALMAALTDGSIAGAGLDVLANEPHVPEPLRKMDNVVLLPHIGSATFETRTEMGDLLINNLEAYFSSKPLLSEVEQ
tara:strand:+ start:491 stop:1435 length:945 start_codon:yes stop_codon:yes gene_type:complete